MLIIPFLIGASTTGYFWYNTKEEEKEQTFWQELTKVLAPVLLLILVLLLFRWLYTQGNKSE
jgi:ACR3 family arsenite efflux pump ArsB